MQSPIENKTDRVVVLLCTYIIAASAFFIAADKLGMGWVRETITGVPAGIWFIMIGAISLGWVLLDRPQPASFNMEDDVRFRKSFPDWIQRHLQPAAAYKWEPNSAQNTKQKTTVSDLRTDPGLVGFLARAADRLIPEKPLRIGITGFDPSLIPSRSEIDEPVQFIPVQLNAEETSGQVFSSYELDAWIHRTENSESPNLFEPSLDYRLVHNVLRITTPDQGKAPDSFVFDFGDVIAPTMGSLFPEQTDISEITIREFDPDNPRQVRALFDLATAMAATARAPYRLTLGDYFLGRKPWSPVRQSRVIGTLLRDMDSSPIHRICARLFIAWFGLNGQTDNTGPWAEGIIEASCCLRDEPFALLQRGAVLTCEKRFDEAIRAFVDATLLLRKTGAPFDEDPAQQLQSEMEKADLSNSNFPGRLAAGITLALANAEKDTRRYVKQDIEDDLTRLFQAGTYHELEDFYQRLISRVMQLPHQNLLFTAA
ncbi:MAG TPA: hypothetical protein ENJ06_01160 [Phycisphaeraceae bacterium]|nr:hypothetical protein [Phycisphaeraceae bacterium]